MFTLSLNTHTSNFIQQYKFGLNLPYAKVVYKWETLLHMIFVKHDARLYPKVTNCPISNFITEIVIGFAWECIFFLTVIIDRYENLIFPPTWISMYNISFMKMTMICCIKWFYI